MTGKEGGGVQPTACGKRIESGEDVYWYDYGAFQSEWHWALKKIHLKDPAWCVKHSDTSFDLCRECVVKLGVEW